MKKVGYYNLNCPKCGISSKYAKLKIIKGDFVSNDTFLTETGYTILNSDMNNEFVICSHCDEIFPLSLCDNANKTFHREVVYLKGVREVVDGKIVATIKFLGLEMDVIMLRVGIKDGKQEPNCCRFNGYDEGWRLRVKDYNNLCLLFLGNESPTFKTTKLPKKFDDDGEWVIFMRPREIIGEKNTQRDDNDDNDADE
ncbi:MAG: hypothetical protein ACFFFC_00520 [Candidatus Thorarchaeota archaeon]